MIVIGLNAIFIDNGSRPLEMKDLIEHDEETAEINVSLSEDYATKD